MKIFVTGATGFLGNSFLKQLLSGAAQDDIVYILIRKEPSACDPRVKPLWGSLENLRQFKEQLLQCEYVFHLAANANLGDGEIYDQMNYEPTKQLIEILKGSTKLHRFIFTSTIGAVDRSRNDLCTAPLSPDSIPSPTTDYGRSKLKAEGYIKSSGIPFTIFRPALVYGSGMRGNSHINVFVSMVYHRALISYFAFPGKISLIHVDDLAKGLVNCINNDLTKNRTYFASTEALSISNILRIIHELVHQGPLFQIPIPSFDTIMARIHSLVPTTVANLFLNYLWAEDDRFQQDLLAGIEPISFKEGIKSVIAANINFAGYWVITGANSGIGLALADNLSAANKKLILIDKNIDNLEKFHNHIIIKCDLSEYEEIVQLSQSLKDRPICCLINNAGLGYRKSFHNISLDEIKNSLAVNVMAPIYLTKLLLAQLISQQSVIVNIASSVAYNPLPNMLMYSASKALLVNWSESLAYELKSTNFVITFSPSGTDTDFQKTAGVRKDESGKGLLKPEYVAEQIIKAVKKKKSVVILGAQTNFLLFLTKFFPRSFNIKFWGWLFKKLR